MRTPWPSRSAPHQVSASWIDGSPKASRVDREVGVLAGEVLERVEVPGGRVARLGPRDVEAADLLLPVADGQLGDLAAHRGVTHGGEQRGDADLPPLLTSQHLALAESLVDGLDDLLEGEVPLEV